LCIFGSILKGKGENNDAGRHILSVHITMLKEPWQIISGEDTNYQRFWHLPSTRISGFTGKKPV
jgi:hypothetical protein